MDKPDIKNRIVEIEAAMLAPDFWSDKGAAQALIRELALLQDNVPGMSLSAVRRVIAADLQVGVDEAYDGVLLHELAIGR